MLCIVEAFTYLPQRGEYRMRLGNTNKNFVFCLVFLSAFTIFAKQINNLWMIPVIHPLNHKPKKKTIRI